MNKEFRTSNIDFVAYLKINGIDFVKTEISKNNGKIMFSYEFDFNKLIDMQNEFNNGLVSMNFIKFKDERNKILDVVKLYN